MIDDDDVSSDTFVIAPEHELAWRVAGTFAITASILSLYQMRLHVKWNSRSDMRKYVLRILLMVPIYGIESWLSLRYTSTAIYFDTARECYEALVIYSFYQFLVEFLGGERRLIGILRQKKSHKHLFPFCCLPEWAPGRPYLYHIKVGILQFVVLKPLMAIISFVLNFAGLYWDGEFSWSVGYPYIMVIDNISQTIALYCLVLFYYDLHDDLAPVHPVPKFLVVKSVVFFTFWQSVCLSLLVHFGVITEIQNYSTDNVVTALQDFLVCIEMFIASIAHHYAFPYREFHDPDSSPNAPPMMHSLMQAVDVTDVFVDDVENALNRDESNLGEHAENSPLLGTRLESKKSRANVYARNRNGFIESHRSDVGMSGSDSDELRTFNLS